MADSNEAAVRAQLAAEAEKVMNESKPTPTTAEVDAIKTGKMNHDDKAEDENPSMRPLHEQRAMVEEARKADQKTAAADAEEAVYRTRTMTPRTRADAADSSSAHSRSRAPADHNESAGSSAPATSRERKPE